MNIQLLRYALEVSRTGSITKASHNLFMAQPNLSKAIKDLEESIGYQIFKRSPSGMEITEKGRIFLGYATGIVSQFDELEKLSLTSEKENMLFKISIPRGSYIMNGIAEFVSKLEVDNKIDITIHETNTMNTIDNVLNRYYDLGIIRYQSIYEDYYIRYLKNNNLHYETIWEFPYVLIMSKRHDLAEKSIVNTEDLKGYIEIKHGDTEIPYIDSKSMDIIRKRNSDHRVIYVYDRGSEFDLLENVESTYMWVSPMPQNYLERYQLVHRGCDKENNRYKDVLIYKNDYEFTEYDREFQKHLYASKIKVSTTKYF